MTPDEVAAKYPAHPSHDMTPWQATLVPGKLTRRCRAPKCRLAQDMTALCISTQPMLSHPCGAPPLETTFLVTKENVRQTWRHESYSGGYLPPGRYPAFVIDVVQWGGDSAPLPPDAPKRLICVIDPRG